MGLVMAVLSGSVVQVVGPQIGPEQRHGKDGKGCRHAGGKNDVHLHEALPPCAARCCSKEDRVVLISIKCGTGRGRVVVRQCNIRTGMVIDPRMPRVAPPSMNSRMREWP